MPKLKPTTTTIIVRQGLSKPKVLNIQKAVFLVKLKKDEEHVLDTVVGTPKQIAEELESYNALGSEINPHKRYEDLDQIEINSYCRRYGLTLLKTLK
jgi:hypothetical protein